MVKLFIIVQYVENMGYLLWGPLPFFRHYRYCHCCHGDWIAVVLIIFWRFLLRHKPVAVALPFVIVDWAPKSQSLFLLPPNSPGHCFVPGKDPGYHQRASRSPDYFIGTCHRRDHRRRAAASSFGLILLQLIGWCIPADF